MKQEDKHLPQKVICKLKLILGNRINHKETNCQSKVLSLVFLCVGMLADA